jgi:predicted KAP-like P-loop ATPase
MSTPIEKPLSADRPLSDPSHDRLGYAPFAKQLATSVLSASPADGLVLALYGEWGTGKSTALNFIIHYLELHEEPPIIVHFNPWWFAGHEDLIRRFFAQFEATISKSKLIKTHARKKRLAGFLSKFGAAVSDVPVMSSLPYVGETAKAVGKGAQLAAGLLEASDVVARKADLAKALAAEVSRIIVVIDDIDRLVPDEMRELFKLVKAVGDLPNVTYLLAFDRDLAADAMGRLHGNAGQQYLEKIVQVPFTLPIPDRGQLQRILFERLDEIIHGTPDGLFDQQEWGNVYLDGIDPFIQKPRDTVRLCNSLGVTYPAVKGEVRAVDFIALEVLRVFVPVAYDAIRTNPSMFSGTLSERSWGGGSRDDERKFHDGWLATVTENADAVLRMVRRLFPRLDGVFSNVMYGNDMVPEWRRRLRVCSPEIFPVYFRFGLAPGEVAAADVRHLLAVIGDHETLIQRLSALTKDVRDDGRTRAGEMLLRLHDHVDGVALDAIPNVVRALFACGDEVVAADTHERSMLDLGDEYRIGWLLRRLLKRFPIDERGSILHAAIMLDGRAVATVVREVAAYARQHDADAERRSSSEETIVRQEDVPDLEALALARVREVALSGELWTRPRFRTLLEALVHWGDGRLARQLVLEHLRDDVAMLDFLRSFTSKLHTRPLTDRVGRSTVCLDPLTLWHLVDDVDVLEARVSSLQRAGMLTPERQVCADAFVRGCRARRQGKEPGWVERDGADEDLDD